MKLLIVLCFLGIMSYKSYASYSTYNPSRPDIDTVSILGLTPGLDGSLVGIHISQKMDTLLWNEDGTGITKFSGSYLNVKGDFRIAYAKGMISQVSFVAPTRNQAETKQTYDRLSQELARVYGQADVTSNTNTQEMRWEGIRQSISVKAVDGTQFVTVALSTFGKH